LAGPHTRTVGIDLSSQPIRTVACVIEWGRPRARILLFHENADDAALLELMLDPAVTKVGIDAPFGWPTEFVNAVHDYSESEEWPDTEQRLLVLRETDRQVREQTGRVPLSVTTDKIAYTAIRCARLLTELRQSGASVDRSGGGRVVEVYPAAALIQWGMSPIGYKGRNLKASARRRSLLETVVAETQDCLELSTEDVATCEAGDHHLDALLAALVARAVEKGHSVRVPAEHLERARREGWIQVPERGSLNVLC